MKAGIGVNDALPSGNATFAIIKVGEGGTALPIGNATLRRGGGYQNEPDTVKNRVSGSGSDRPTGGRVSVWTQTHHASAKTRHVG